MYECESWTIKKAERRKIDVFELWYLRRLLRVPWTARRSNQSILKETVLNIHWKDRCWSWNPNTLATDVRNWLIWKDPDAGKDWRQEEKGTTEDEMVAWRYWLNEHDFEEALELVMDREAWHAAVNGVPKSWTWLNDWPELNWDFHGSPVVKTLCSHCRGHRFYPWLEN